MPLPGTKPAETKRRRNAPTHEWTEVERVRFDGGPKLPAKMPDGRGWPQWTKDWWQAVSTMPHCLLWEEEDWRFALETAIVAASFHTGDIKAATELRQREKVMGTTIDSRRDLRIRYVEPAIEAPAGISAIDEYRARLAK